MIVAEQKPIDEIRKLLKGRQRVFVLGCGGCVTVCLAGGKKEVGIIAGVLRLSGFEQVEEDTVERQCDAEFFEPVREKIGATDAVLSLACGVGVQMVTRLFPEKAVFPGLNTKFMGTNDGAGRWSENCLACGDCKLGIFGGVCPVTRCAKSLSNGPCGGSSNGRCEVDPDRLDCGWQLIYDRMKKLGQLDNLLEITPPRDWSRTHAGGPRILARLDIEEP
ncbi:MAG: methylenetetrahydrofolate reductase C-terminal domain-containing protein [Kiritimatiellae bacterium]|nr:methylenetetrahydrofolate reductase C-terminal domain-containing protein [Kiritimatiellia bacterium]